MIDAFNEIIIHLKEIIVFDILEINIKHLPHPQSFTLYTITININFKIQYLKQNRKCLKSRVELYCFKSFIAS